MYEFKYVLCQLKLVNSSLTDVMFTKFQIIIPILVLLIATNVFKLKFIEFSIN